LVIGGRKAMRFRMRTLLCVIATLAVAIGVAQALERRGLYRRCAEYHRVKEDLARALAVNPKASVAMCGTGYEGVPRLASDPCRSTAASGSAPGRREYLADAAFHARMSREYESRGWW